MAALFPALSYGAKNKHPSSASISAITGSILRADFLFSNGNVITLDRASNISEAVAIRGSKIVAVGNTAELETQIPPETRRIDLKGRSVLPGFFDTHPHMDREGLKSLGGESLAGADFAFVIDYSVPGAGAGGIANDLFSIGIATVNIPLPAVAWLFPAGLVAGLGWMRRTSKAV